jgi:Rrf2 family protein
MILTNLVENFGGGRMHIGTKGDYGVRALIDLALYGGERPVQRSEIARRQHIPESYLDHLLAQLRRAGFVRSTRGPGGGHQLTRPAEEICLLHILESLEGSLAPLPCLEDDEAGGEPHSVCAQQWVWREIYDDMRRRLAAVSLAELASRERARQRELVAAAGSYSI